LKVELKVDGREVPLNPFVSKIVGNLLQAIISSLHGIDEAWREAVFKLER